MSIVTVLREIFKSKVFKSSIGLPVNFQERNFSKDSLDKDVDYAISIGLQYFNLLKEKSLNIENTAILEIGPGINFGSIFMLACLGASIYVVDRFISKWDENYHFNFYKLLRSKLKLIKSPTFDLTILDKLIKAKNYDKKIIKIIESKNGEFISIPNNSINYIFSNAVLEHINDYKLYSELYRISKPDSFGFHQIDFRDHRDFNRPLEYLLMDKRDFGLMFLERHGECGNQLRSTDYQHLFQNAGFVISDFEPNMFAEEDYLTDFMRRMIETNCPFKNIPLSELKIISGRFITYKKRID